MPGTLIWRIEMGYCTMDYLLVFKFVYHPAPSNSGWYVICIPVHRDAFCLHWVFFGREVSFGDIFKIYLICFVFHSFQTIWTKSLNWHWHAWNYFFLGIECSQLKSRGYTCILPTNYVKLKLPQFHQFLKSLRSHWPSHRRWTWMAKCSCLKLRPISPCLNS